MFSTVAERLVNRAVSTAHPRRDNLSWSMAGMWRGITRAVQRTTILKGGYAPSSHHAPCPSLGFLWGSALHSILLMGAGLTI